VGELVIAGGDATPIFNLAEEVLDLVSPPAKLIAPIPLQFTPAF
jgi:hypothetical protein